MKIIFCNLGYGRGHDGSLLEYVTKAYRFFKQSTGSQKQILDIVADLIHKESPDVFTYAEISSGSFKNGYFDQHRYLLEQFKDHVVIDAILSKYGETVINLFPFHTGNANGVVSFLPARIHEYYLKKSRKRLVFKIVLQTCTVFTVHLPLVSRDRKSHLLELAELVRQEQGDVVVCGDFNIFDGIDELSVLQSTTGLSLAGEKVFTFPSHHPKRQLDVFLYRFRDSSVVPKMRVIDSCMSDHLPIVLEW